MGESTTEENGSLPQSRRFNKKGGKKSGRQSRFLKKARKEKECGRLGRGFHVDQEVYNYYLTVIELWQKNQFETEEERDNFIENAFAQTEGHEVNYVTNQMVSRAVETLLPSVMNPEVLLTFANALSTQLRVLSTDAFASHILEKLFEVIPDKWSEDKKLMKWFRSTCQFVFNNYEEFIFDKYANHVMRRACTCLSGINSQCLKGEKQSLGISLSVQFEEKENPKKIEGNTKKKSVKILKEFAERFLAWPQVPDLIFDELTNAFLQVFLTSLKAVDEDLRNKGTMLIANTMKPELNSADKVNIGYMFTIEKVISIANEEIFKLIYNKSFKENLEALSKNQTFHFAIEKLLINSPNKEMFEEIYTDLCPNFQSFYQSGFTSIFAVIGFCCKFYKSNQSSFINELNTLVENNKTQSMTDNFFHNILNFGKFEKFEVAQEESERLLTELNGSMIVQQLLNFHKPQKITNCILELESTYLVKLADDPKGSYIIESFFKSSTIGEKNKELLFNKFKEYLVNISCSKFGSRVIDCIWAWASIKSKKAIASELAERISQLNSNRFGKFISEKCDLLTFKRDENGWMNSMSVPDKKKKDGKRKKESALDDIVSDLNLKLPVKKKSKKSI